MCSGIWAVWLCWANDGYETRRFWTAASRGFYTLEKEIG